MPYMICSWSRSWRTKKAEPSVATRQAEKDGRMEAVFGILGAVLDALCKFSIWIFLGGFFGVLLTFLWFLFRYLDKKKLFLPVVVFTLCFLVFLSGSILLLLQDAGRIGSGAVGTDEPAEQTADTEADTGGEPA